MLLKILLLLALLLPQSAWAVDAADLERTAAQLEQKRAQEADIKAAATAATDTLKSLSDERVRLSTIIQQIEQDRLEQEELLLRRRAEMNQARALLAENLTRNEQTVQNLLKLARQPPLLTMLTPESANDTRQGAALLRWYSEQLQRDVAEINARLDVLSDAEVAHGLVLERLKKDSDRLSNEGQRLDDKLREKKRQQASLQQSAAKLHKELTRLAAQEQSMKQFLSELSRRHSAEESVAPAKDPEPEDAASEDAPAQESEPRGLVAGKIIHRFGDALKGMTSQGVTYSGSAGSLVTAPLRGKVAYAGAYGRYGNVVILEVKRGQHLVLAGLGRLLVQSGERLAAGEPVGRLESGGGNCCTLYVELRKGGSPINPLPYLQRPAT